MLNFNRNERPGDARPNETRGLKPSVPLNATPTPPTSSVGRYGTGTSSPAPSSSTGSSASTLPPPPTTHEVHEPAAAKDAAAAPVSGAKLIVGRNVKLKGVEISDCEMVVVEGQVEASVAAKGMQIAKPGTLKGNAVIDVAEIDGDFTGELTAHSKLVVNGTGRVSGTIRYGSLIVAEGGEVTGDVKRIEDTTPMPRPSGDRPSVSTGTPR